MSDKLLDMIMRFRDGVIIETGGNALKIELDERAFRSAQRAVATYLLWGTSTKPVNITDQITIAGPRGDLIITKATMSKASDWVKKCAEARAVGPEPFTAGSGIEHKFDWSAEVDYLSGRMKMDGGKTIAPNDALRLADWIRDTFGEKPTP